MRKRKELRIERTKARLALRESPWMDLSLRELVPHKLRPITPLEVYDELAQHGEPSGVSLWGHKLKYTLSTGDRIVLSYRDEKEAEEALNKVRALSQSEFNFLLSILDKRYRAFRYEEVPEGTKLNRNGQLDWLDPKFVIEIERKVYDFSLVRELQSLLQDIWWKDTDTVHLFTPMLKEVARKLHLERTFEELEKSGAKCTVVKAFEKDLELLSDSTLEELQHRIELSLAPLIALAETIVKTEEQTREEEEELAKEEER